MGRDHLFPSDGGVRSGWIAARSLLRRVIRRCGGVCLRSEHPLARGFRRGVAVLPSWVSAGMGQYWYDQLPSPRVLLLCVYRRRNASILGAALTGVVSGQTDIRLWALDETAPDLAQHTRGQGRGARCDLLNRLVSDAPVDADWVVVIDDDVRLLDRWTITSMIGVMARFDVDFAQPAHAYGSIHSHLFNYRRPLIVGRQVRAVEIGPLFIVRRPWAGHVIPFPRDAGMGYFLEWVWSELASEGCRSAVLDCVPMEHLGAVGADYGWIELGDRRHLDGSPAGSVESLNSGTGALRDVLRSRR